jgi:ribonuclease VapC
MGRMGCQPDGPCTSAIFALIANEPEARQFQEAILSAETLAISAVTALETRIVLLGRYGAEMSDAFDQLIADAGVAIVPFDDIQAATAFDAFTRYGKGQGHPAQLNICDCASYALAKTRGEPLLFKGNDFARTDIVSGA